MSHLFSFGFDLKNKLYVDTISIVICCFDRDWWWHIARLKIKLFKMCIPNMYVHSTKCTFLRKFITISHGKDDISRLGPSMSSDRWNKNRNTCTLHVHMFHWKIADKSNNTAGSCTDSAVLNLVAFSHFALWLFKFGELLTLYYGCMAYGWLVNEYVDNSGPVRIYV